MDEGQTGDGRGREFQRVLKKLRTRMVNGVYPWGTFFPAQRALAEEFGVSRDTVQRVLKALEDDGWIESRQGSRSRVLMTQRMQPAFAQSAKLSRTAFGPIIAEAFDRPEVTLDVYTLTAESLDTHIRLQAERIREAKQSAPQRIAVRMLVPSERIALPYPVAKNDPSDPRPAERVRNIARRSADSLKYVLDSLQVERLVPEVTLEIRHALVPPTFKLYLLNGSEALFGTYRVAERPIILDSGEVIDALDVVGIGADLTYSVKDADTKSPASFFVDSMQTWFDSVWELFSD
ncbi:GntR family transcriptional regulator [Streptomyces sp. SAS_270]|uniref:GntR family transcriptional regulator n=1 Tax=Streptomyces sp. SAS_270 TaxID=3412748 RepID=UPI00403D469E